MRSVQSLYHTCQGGAEYHSHAPQANLARPLPSIGSCFSILSALSVWGRGLSGGVRWADSGYGQSDETTAHLRKAPAPLSLCNGSGRQPCEGAQRSAGGPHMDTCCGCCCCWGQYTRRPRSPLAPRGCLMLNRVVPGPRLMHLQGREREWSRTRAHTDTLAHTPPRGGDGLCPITILTPLLLSLPPSPPLHHFPLHPHLHPSPHSIWHCNKHTDHYCNVSTLWAYGTHFLQFFVRCIGNTAV